MKKYGFGVDVGGTTIKMGFFETDGKLLDKWEIKTDTTNGGENILSDIAKSIDNKLAQEGISKRTLETAKKELGIKAKRINGSWYWDLHKDE